MDNNELIVKTKNKESNRKEGLERRDEVNQRSGIGKQTSLMVHIWQLTKDTDYLNAESELYPLKDL